MKLKSIAKQVLLSLIALTSVGSAQASEEFLIMTESDSRAPESATLRAAFGDNYATVLCPKSAIREYTRAITLDPSFGRVNSKDENYFLSYGKNGQNSKVMDHLLDKYNKLLKKTPTDPYALAVRGEIKFVLNDAEGAEADFKKSLHFDPKLSFSNLRLAEVGLFLQSSNNSITYSKQAVTRFPNDARMHCNLGLAYKANGDIEKAIAEYDKAIKLNPRFSRAYLNRAVAKSTTDDFAAEFSDISTCLSLEPDLTVAHSFSTHEHARLKQCMATMFAKYGENNLTDNCKHDQPNHSQNKSCLLTFLTSLTALLVALIPRQLQRPMLFHQ